MDTNKRIAKLNLVLSQLRHGKNVQNRQLRKVLTEEEFLQFEDDWRRQIELRSDLKNKPDAIVEYEAKLKEATFTYCKADSFSSRGKHDAAKKLFAKADTQFERLVEFIEERIAIDSSLWLWFDRNVVYDVGDEPHSCPENFPCVVTSSSHRNMGGGFLKMKYSKRETKLNAVEDALMELNNPHTDNEVIQERIRAGKKLRNSISK